MESRSTSLSPILIDLGREDGDPRKIFTLAEGETRLGRASTSDVRIDGDPRVSRTHCRIVRNGEIVRIRDEGKNRTRLGRGFVEDGQRLEDGAVLTLGSTRLLLRLPLSLPGACASAPRETGAASSAPPPLLRPASLEAPGAAARSPAIAPRASRARVLATASEPRDDRASVANPSRRRSWRRRSPLGALAVAVAVVGAAGMLVFVLVMRRDDALPASDLASSSMPESGIREIDPGGTLIPAGPLSNSSARSVTQARTKRGSEGEALEDEASAPDGRDRDAALASLDDDPLLAARSREDASASESRVDVEKLGPLTAGSSKDAYFSRHVLPFLARHCTGCHGEEKQEGDLTLHEFTDAKLALEDREVWELVATKVRAGKMPPEDRQRPADSEIAAVVGWIEKAVLGKDEGKIDPGRVTMRRLNNYEYNSTVRDLLGVDIRPADSFPADEIGYGFDNIADLLSMPPLLMEKYLNAASAIVDALWARDSARERVLLCTPKKRSEVSSCARKILREIATRAFRRPVTASELSRLTKFVTLAEKNGDGFELGVQLALQAILVSPHFLFRVELDPRPDDPESVRQLNEWELASRLSYFIWSSMPDDELFELARKKTLKRPAKLAEQVTRMLRDPKARGLTETFAALWLGSRALESSTPDPGTYPEFDEGLREAMRRETELFFEEVLREDLSVLVFLDSDFTYLNRRLARHYGIAGVDGDGFKRVSLEGSDRGGVLTQGTVLTTTSNPTRTSPVKRGKWILEEILGSPPPPPPPGVDSLPEDEAESEALSLRELMQRHRRDPACATCHLKMDTLGLAFENYDGVGRWRDRDGAGPIDASGKLPDGQAFTSLGELRKILASSYSDDFSRCLTEKLLTFALGRGLEYSDTDFVERIAATLKAEKHRFSVLVREIVLSDLFRMRRGERPRLDSAGARR